jgi:hypothetical protein
VPDLSDWEKAGHGLGAKEQGKKLCGSVAVLPFMKSVGVKGTGKFLGMFMVHSP